MYGEFFWKLKPKLDLKKVSSMKVRSQSSAVSDRKLVFSPGKDNKRTLLVNPKVCFLCLSYH